MRLNRPGTILLTALIAVAANGCASSTTSTGAVNNHVDQQAMIAAWERGACPGSGTGWGGFDAGLPQTSAPDGARVSVLPGTIDRMLLCRFTGGQRTLSAGALVTDPAVIAHLQNDLNSVTATNNPTCTSADEVMIIAGSGTSTASINVSLAPCPYLNNSAQAARYSATSLAHDLAAALSQPGSPSPSSIG